MGMLQKEEMTPLESTITTFFLPALSFLFPSSNNINKIYI